MPSSLVTGGAGFIGSHVCDQLIRMGHEVVVLDDLSSGRREHVHPHAYFVQGSILDPALLEALFKNHQFDYVFHFAPYLAIGLSHFIKRLTYTANIIGSVNVINAAVNRGCVKCFIYLSSISVYGDQSSPLMEDMTPMPKDPYSIAKYTVELDLKESYEMFGLPFVIFRAHNVYGERQKIGDPYRNVVGILVHQAMRSEPFTVFGDGTQKQCFTYIQTVAPAVARACERKEAYNQVFNIGAEEPSTINHLAQVVAESVGVPRGVNYLEPRKEVVYRPCSHEKAKAVFGDLITEVTLREGVGRMAAWAKAIGPQETEPFHNIEVRKNMPPAWIEFSEARRS